ncbi:MAG: ZIP family magnesium transporter [Gemmatimonadetes bacterium]|nr:MAG: ZIP family magnesium transporter [Gemmatimonadota bacterium]
MHALFYASVAAAGNLAGALVLTARDRWSRRSIEFLLAFSAGLLVAVSLSELVPESVIRGGAQAGWWILGGFALLHLTQHALLGHFHFGGETHAVSRSVGVSALIGLMLHTLVDGVAIATSFAVSDDVGYVVLVAIVLHKLPEGLAIGSLFIASGRSVAAAIGAAGALGLATIIGAALAGQVDFLATHGLALSAGTTLYVGACNLLPDFKCRTGWSHNACFFGGVAAYAVAAVILAQ